MKNGTLIAFEGIDGSGKSTQVARLAGALDSSGLDVVTTREPTDGPVGQRIRAMAQSDERIAPEQELAWFLEDRSQHVETVIGPALAAGRVVVTDRYTLSSVAYQGARGLDPMEILARSEARFPLPDLALVIQIDPKAGLERVRTRGGVAEPRFEEAEFLTRAAKIFAELPCAYIERVSGLGSADEVSGRIRAAVARRLALD